MMLFITSCLVLDNKKSKVESASLTIVSRWFLLLDLNLSVALGTSESQFRYFQGVFQWKTKGTRASITRTPFFNFDFWPTHLHSLPLSDRHLYNTSREKVGSQPNFFKGKKEKKKTVTKVYHHFVVRLIENNSTCFNRGHCRDRTGELVMASAIRGGAVRALPVARSLSAQWSGRRVRSARERRFRGDLWAGIAADGDGRKWTRLLARRAAQPELSSEHQGTRAALHVLQIFRFQRVFGTRKKGGDKKKEEKRVAYFVIYSLRSQI